MTTTKPCRTKQARNIVLSLLSGVERPGPPGGGPARAMGPGRAGARAQRGADESTRRIGGSGGPSLSGDTSSTILPGSATAGSSSLYGCGFQVGRGRLRQCVAYAGAWKRPGTGRVLFPWGRGGEGKKEREARGASLTPSIPQACRV
jgi:hypothetical protein